MKKKRALWLLNHSTLRNFEVPLLIEMGYEVYCPKMFPYDEGNLSANVDFKYDNTLSIPSNVLERFNEVNFYGQVSNEIMDLMNEYFDIVFFAFFPKQLKMLTYGFKGVLVLRPFGLSSNVSYTSIIIQELGLSFLSELESLGERFFFGQAYENISELEFRYFKIRSIYLPIGLKNAHFNDKWEGSDNRILFICPRINSNAYYKNIYNKFRKDFKKFTYVIGGNQAIDVTDDKSVVGYIPQDQYEYNMTKLSLMYYHSREKRHLHYHPIEAIKNGMPLIFMSGGMLDNLGGENLPGRCETIKDAQKKISRILSGDRKLINSIKGSQNILLNTFKYEFCREKWEIAFENINRSIEILKEISKIEKRKKIGIIIPAEYTGGVLDHTIRLIKSINKGILEDLKATEIVLGYVDHENFIQKDYFGEIKQLNIPCRSFKWELFDEDRAKNYYNLRGYPEDDISGQYCVLNDGIDDFQDCDYLIFTSDRLPATLLSSKPYAVIVWDVIQRYFPNMFSNYYEKPIIDAHRNADTVLVSTPATLEDVIQYSGIRRDKIKLFPPLFDFLDLPKENEYKIRIDSSYFLWSTNAAMHKNHKIALDALVDYYLKGGKMKCYMTGVDTNLFNPKEKYDGDSKIINDVRKIINNNKELKRNLVFMGNMDKDKYLVILKNAKFIIHPGYGDNGNGTSIDAAMLGVPTLSSDYPAMRYYNEYMELNIRFFNKNNFKELTELLLKTESDYESLMSKLPDREMLHSLTINYTYKKIYNIFKDMIKL